MTKEVFRSSLVRRRSRGRSFYSDIFNIIQSGLPRCCTLSLRCLNLPNEDTIDTNENVIFMYHWSFQMESICNKKLQDIINSFLLVRSLKQESILSYLKIVVKGEIMNIFTRSFDLGNCLSVFHLRYKDGMSFSVCLYILQKILSALSYLKSCKIVHNSIRCKNIFIDTSGIVQLGSFMNATKAKAVNISGKEVLLCREAPKDIVSDLPWLAPEILKQNLNGYSFDADIYSCGITFLEMYFKQVPFKSSNQLKNFSFKINGESSQLAMVFCIFTGKYFAKSGVSTFFDHLIQANELSKGVDYGYTKVFNKVIKEYANTNCKVYKLVKEMTQSNSSKRISLECLLKHKIFKKIPHHMSFNELDSIYL